MTSIARGKRIHTTWQNRWLKCKNLGEFIDTFPRSAVDILKKDAKHVYTTADLYSIPAIVIVEYDMDLRRADAVLVTLEWVCIFEIKSTTMLRRSSVYKNADKKQLSDTRALLIRRLNDVYKNDTIITMTVNAYLFYIKLWQNKIFHMIEQLHTPAQVVAPVCDLFKRRRYPQKLRVLYEAIFMQWMKQRTDVYKQR